MNTDEEELAQVEIREHLILPMDLHEPRATYTASRAARCSCDDPRNGISLCRRHHWAFDAGLFTVTAGLLVRLSPAVSRAEQNRFDLAE